MYATSELGEVRIMVCRSMLASDSGEMDSALFLLSRGVSRGLEKRDTAQRGPTKVLETVADFFLWRMIAVVGISQVSFSFVRLSGLSGICCWSGGLLLDKLFLEDLRNFLVDQ